MAEAGANDLTANYESGIDLRGREDELLALAHTALRFEVGPEGIVSQTHWWGLEEVPAFQASGAIDKHKVLLKVQGVEPLTSEITALQQFDKASKYAHVRPPRLVASMPWSEEHQVELLAIEKLNVDLKVIGLPTNRDEIARFGEVYRSYRDVAEMAKPWVPKPTETIIDEARRTMASQQRIAAEQFADNPLYSKQDEPLIAQGLDLLEKLYQGVDRTFQHTHISSDDVFGPTIASGDPRFIYTSNFMWGWKPPFYDATLALYHYPRLLSDRYLPATPQLLDKQFNLWLDWYYGLAENENDTLLQKTVLLEQMLNSLCLSVYTMDHPERSSAEQVIRIARRTATDLLEELSS